MSPTALGTPIILDGGMSRELIRLGAPFQQPEWSALSLLEAPQFVSQVHADFLAAGADVVTTNSYAIVPFHIGEARFWERGRELAALAGRLAREAADNETAKTGREVLVAGSLPPIFGSYEPDKFDPETVHRYLGLLVKALDPYVDVWLAETLSLIAEAKAARTATTTSSKPFWVSFTPNDSQGAGTTTPQLRSGESLVEAAEWALSSSVDALLFNCARPEYMAGAVEIANSVFSRDHSRKKPLLGVYANAFVPRPDTYAANKDVAPTDQDLNGQVYCRFASEWIASGVEIVGGCCGISNVHIQELAKQRRGSIAKS